MGNHQLLLNKIGSYFLSLEPLMRSPSRLQHPCCWMLRYNQACCQGHCEDFFRLAISPKNIFQDSGKAADKYVYGYGLAF